MSEGPTYSTSATESHSWQRLLDNYKQLSYPLETWRQQCISL